MPEAAFAVVTPIRQPKAGKVCFQDHSGQLSSRYEAIPGIRVNAARASSVVLPTIAARTSDAVTTGAIEASTRIRNCT